MKKLYKSREDRMISGVLGGIAEYFGIDSTLLRILYTVAIVFGVGSPIILYVILAILIPEPKISTKSRSRDYDGYYKTKSSRKKAPKEAEKVNDDDWSDF